MNLQQLEYIIAVDTHRHFLKAADSCFVTQATLSMMIKKLEEELDVLIFDRSKQPVIPTEAGYKVITHARRILNEASSLRDAVQIEKGVISGDLRLGIIPTIAPYLIPLFLKDYRAAYPKVNLHITEYTTETIIEKLKSGQIDAGILATPLREKTIKEKPLYYEKYFLYVNENEKGFDKKYVLPKHIDIERLWLLEEGHCMRSQILNLCELKRKQSHDNNLHYEAGSIETLVNLVDNNYGVTVVPELAASRLSGEQKDRLRYFKDPEPVREISIVTHYEYVKERLIRTLKDSILEIIPKDMKKQGKKNVIDI